MAITLHLYYKGENGKAKQFMEEMEQSGTAAAIRAEKATSNTIISSQLVTLKRCF